MKRKRIGLNSSSQYRSIAFLVSSMVQIHIFRQMHSITASKWATLAYNPRVCASFCSNNFLSNRCFYSKNTITSIHNQRRHLRLHKRSFNPRRKEENYRYFSVSESTSFDESNPDVTSDEKISLNEMNWSSHPSLSETYHIPTILVPSDSVHSVIKEGILTPYLVTHKKEFENIHPRIKAVRDPETLDDNFKLDGAISMKAILLDPTRVTNDANEYIKREYDKTSDSVERRQTVLTKAFPKIKESAIDFLVSNLAHPGPVTSVTLPYTKQTIQHILSKILPEDAQPPPSGFEQIGHVVHLNLKSRHYPYRKIIGSVILDRLSPKIKTVVNKVGEVGGPYRTYDMEVLAGSPDTNVKVIEDGISLNFDLRKVYWCTRLSGERLRLINDEFREGQIIADAFSGVGALCFLAASKLGCSIYANDLNPNAVKSLRENAKKNRKKMKDGYDDHFIDVSCEDAFDFIQNLGGLQQKPHHVVMNYPLDSASFLGGFRWWTPSKKDVKTDQSTNVHLYTFARGDDTKNENSDIDDKPRDAIDVAIDLVADGLLPEGGAIQKSRYRKAYLDKLGCEVRAREVRDVAPGKVVICVSFKVTNSLLKVMHGDFIDI